MCNLIERTIIQQINNAVDPDYLADLIDDDTRLLEGPVPNIMKQLFEIYGAITPQPSYKNPTPTRQTSSKYNLRTVTMTS